MTYMIVDLGFIWLLSDRDKRDILQGNLRALTTLSSNRFACGYILGGCGVLCSGQSVTVGEGESHGGVWSVAPTLVAQKEGLLTTIPDIDEYTAEDNQDNQYDDSGHSYADAYEQPV